MRVSLVRGRCQRQDPSPILGPAPYPECSPSHHRLSLPRGQEQEWSKPRSLRWDEEPWAAEAGSPAIAGLAGVRGHGKGMARLGSSSSAHPGQAGWTGEWMQERKPISARRRKERQKMGCSRNAARAERG